MAPHFVTLGLFIIDEFEYLDELGNRMEKSEEPQIGGGGTYAAIGSRIWLTPDKIGMIVDRGRDFPQNIQSALDAYGKEMWSYRDNELMTTRAANIYRGHERGFKYLTPRRRLVPADLQNTHFDRPANLHFICSPSRAQAIISEVLARPDWNPVIIYEPIPDRCVPEELSTLVRVLPNVHVLSPNADEALSLLSMPRSPTREAIEQACSRLLQIGVGPQGKGYVIIRSGALGAYVASRENSGHWIEAYWSDSDNQKIVDETGAGNSFLGGLSAGLLLTNGNVIEGHTVNSIATFYATVSASFTIEQFGLPKFTLNEDGAELWNGDIPARRLQELRDRHPR